MNILITGSNRGIGLGLARAYISKGAYVIATCRTLENVEELETLRNSHGDQLKILQLDVKKQKQLVSLDEELGDLSIDILYLNAGITGGRKAVPFGDLESQEWSEVLMVNSIAPILVAQRMLPRIRRSGSKTIAILTSQMGSISNNTTGGVIHLPEFQGSPQCWGQEYGPRSQKRRGQGCPTSPGMGTDGHGRAQRRNHRRAKCGRYDHTH